MLLLEDINKLEDHRKKIRKEIYSKIYEQFERKIKQCVEMGHKQVILRVPTFMMGFPPFDRIKAAHYIERQFKNGGFIVSLMSEIDIYVSWDIKKEREKEKEKEEQDIVDFPSLMNLKKIANKYRRQGA